MDTHRLSLRMKITAAIVAGFGIACALALIAALSAPIALLVDALTWPVDGATLLQDPEGRLVMAILAGVLVGWGVLIWLLSDTLLHASPDLVRRLVTMSIVVWFLVDSVASLLAGAPVNVTSNTAFLVALLAPLWVGVAPAVSNAPLPDEGRR